MGLLSGIGKFVGKGLGFLAKNATGIGTGLEVLGGLKAATDTTPGPRSQAYNSLMGAFKAADEAGLHRLAVAGSPAGYSPVPSQAAEGLLSAGQALRGHASDKKQNELLDAQIEEARSRTILNNANARRALMGPQPGLGGPSTRLQRIVEGGALDGLPNGGPRSISNEPQRDMPARQRVTLGDNTAVGPNPEAFEVGLSELLAGIIIYGPQWAYNALGGGPLDSNRGGGNKSPRRNRQSGPRPNQPGYRP